MDCPKTRLFGRASTASTVHPDARQALPENQVEGVKFYPGLFTVIENDIPGPGFVGKRRPTQRPRFSPRGP